MGSVLGTQVRAGQGVPEGMACLLLRERQAQFSWARPGCCQAQLCVLRWEQSHGMWCESVHQQMLQAASTLGVGWIRAAGPAPLQQTPADW